MNKILWIVVVIIQLGYLQFGNGAEFGDKKNHRNGTSLQLKTDAVNKPKREILSRKQKERQIAETLPNNDPSYGFSFRTGVYSRREDADITGKVRGLYSFIDDVGEKHLVRYAASADRGFEVLNSVPDASRYVRYSAPLYKTSPKARGRIAYERGPGRQYKFISSGPDQRRSESTGPDGITRGSYSFLDDKGVQRTTQYIAGPNIGYRIVQSTTGTGTHLLPRPALVEFGILYPQSNNRVDTNNDNDRDEKSGGRGGSGGSGGSGGTGGSGGSGNGSNNGDFPNGNDDDDFGGGNNPDDDENTIGDSDENSFDNGSGPNAGNGNNPNDVDNIDKNNNNRKGSRPASNNGNGSDRRPDFPKRGKDSTIITNIGNSFFGIPPGSSARAHVQNIDLQPFEAVPSPSEALRRHERNERLRQLRIYN